MLYQNFLDLIGNTPLVKLDNIKKLYNLKSDIYAKCENFNLSGSVKDRIALYMIENAEKKGLLKKGGIIIEPTSGNTGIGLASVGKLKGYKVMLTMPESMSEERRKILKAYGAEVILTPAQDGMKGSIKKAYELKEKYDNSIILNQFENLDNPQTHYLTTGPEIYKDIKDLDFFVSGIGTGGTISGVGKYLKEKNPKIKIIGVEPSLSPLISKNYAGSHKIQGIGANFIPKTLSLFVIDEIITISDDEAFNMSNQIAKNEGILVGISSGAALKAAINIAQKYENKKIVVVFPDNGMRYLSTTVYDD